VQCLTDHLAAWPGPGDSAWVFIVGQFRELECAVRKISHAVKDKCDVQELTLSDIERWKRNPRMMTAAARAALRSSLRRFGYVEPIVVNRRDGRLRIVGGHQRAELLIEAGVKRARCVVVELSEADAAALSLTLNNRAAQGEFAPEAAELLAELGAQVGAEVFAELALAELQAGFAAEPLDLAAPPAPEPPAATVSCPKCGFEFEP